MTVVSRKIKNMIHAGITVDESEHDWIESLPTSRFGHQSYW